MVKRDASIKRSFRLGTAQFLPSFLPFYPNSWTAHPNYLQSRSTRPKRTRTIRVDPNEHLRERGRNNNRAGF